MAEPTVAAVPYDEPGETLHTDHQQPAMASGRLLETWVLDFVPVHSSAAIFDAGYGPLAWPLLLQRGVDPARLVCAALSLDVLQAATQANTPQDRSPRFVAAALDVLPFRSGLFDGVMANRVLVHAADPGRAVRELGRVLAADGWLLATTDSEPVDGPFLNFHNRALARLGIAHEAGIPSVFSMEEGAALLRVAFRRVDWFILEGENSYADVDAFLAFYKNTGGYQTLVAQGELPHTTKEDLLDLVRGFALEVLEAEGSLRLPMRMGAFVCRDPVSGA